MYVSRIAGSSNVSVSECYFKAVKMVDIVFNKGMIEKFNVPELLVAIKV